MHTRYALGFVFLTALVVAMNLMSRIAAKFQPVAAVSDEDDDVVAAIAAAITEHRRR